MTIDGGRPIDWGRTSSDYAAHRPGPPPSYYERLAALGVGTPGQRLLDLATGTGLVARSFAARGCHVAGCDIAPEQVEMAVPVAGMWPEALVPELGAGSYPPIRALHSTDDPVVPFEPTRGLLRRMREAGLDVTLVPEHDDQHRMTRQQHRLQRTYIEQALRRQAAGDLG